MELRGVVLAESLRPSAAARCLSRARWFLMATAARLMTMTAEWNAAQIFLKIVAAVMILSPISNDESIGCLVSPFFAGKKLQQWEKAMILDKNGGM